MSTFGSRKNSKTSTTKYHMDQSQSLNSSQHILNNPPQKQYVPHSNKNSTTNCVLDSFNKGLNKRLSDYIDRKLLLQQVINPKNISHQQNNNQIFTQEPPTGQGEQEHQNLQSVDHIKQKVILQSKIEFYGREEAIEQMIEEQEQRQSLSRERDSLVRKQIIQKEHQVITDEISKSQNSQSNASSRLSRRDNFIDQFEQNYKHQVMNEQAKGVLDLDIEDKPLDSSKLDELASNQKTLDTNTFKINVLSNKNYMNTPQTQSDLFSINEQLQNQQYQTSSYDTNDRPDKNTSTLNRSLIIPSYEVQSTQDNNRINDTFEAITTTKSQNQNTNLRKSFGRQVHTQLQSPEPVSLKSSIISQKSMKNPTTVLQNKPSNQKVKVLESSSGSKVKNNFSKQSQLRDQQLRSSFNDTVKENLKNNLLDAVKNFELSKDQERIEDMILELNRLTQISNGKIPAKQQAQIQKLINDIESQKLTYSKKQQNTITSPIRSPNNLSQTLRGSIHSIINQPSSQQKSQTNPNSQLLKNIIRHTESKVKQALTSGKNSNRCSMERTAYHTKNESINLDNTGAFQIFDIENVDQSELENNQIREKTIDQLKDDLLDLLNTLNARSLANLLRSNRGGSQMNEVDYEIGYLFALIVSMVDESIPLNNDKSDLLRKTWGDICKYLSNHGRIIYSLQKLRVVFERQDTFLKQFNKLQINKKFEERRDFLFSSTDKQNLILRFISDLIDIFKSLQKKIVKQIPTQPKITNPKTFKMTQAGFFSPQQTSRVKINFNQPYYNLSPEKSDSPTIPKTTKNQAYQQNSNSRPSSRTKIFSSPNKDKPLTLQQQLLQQKQHAVQKSYQLQLDQSISFRQQADQAKEKELQIAKLKLQQKYLLFQLDKQEQIKQDKEIKEKELENMKLQAQFNSYLRQSKQDAVSTERQLIRERSLENQEFKRASRMKDLEEQLRKHREENEKSMQEYQFNLQLQQQRRTKQNEECKRKQQEMLIEKVRQSEQYLSQKESELDERLKNQFEQASYRFKKLDETENNIKKELQTLKKIIQPYQNKQQQ